MTIHSRLQQQQRRQTHTHHSGGTVGETDWARKPEFSGAQTADTAARLSKYQYGPAGLQPPPPANGDSPPPRTHPSPPPPSPVCYHTPPRRALQKLQQQAGRLSHRHQASQHRRGWLWRRPSVRPSALFARCSSTEPTDSPVLCWTNVELPMHNRLPAP